MLEWRGWRDVSAVGVDGDGGREADAGVRGRGDELKKVLGFIAFVTLSTNCLAETVMQWPQLPSSGFVAGRSATKADVEAGQAVFSMDGKSEGPLKIVIPQYALWTDEAGTPHPVVVVQAERGSGGMQIVGLLNADGSYAAATLPELKLLGTEKPN